MRNKKIIKLLIRAIALTIIIIFIFNLFKVIKETIKNSNKMNAAMEEDLPSTYKLPSEYLELINTKYQAKVSTEIIINSKALGRNPVALINFDNKYQLYIYKIDITNDSPLQKIIYTKSQLSKEEVGITYTSAINGLYEFMTKSGSVQKASFIYFYYDADTMNSVIKNDSIVSYNVFTTNLSVRYKEDQTADILILDKCKTFLGTNKIAIDILFLRRNNSIYILTMAANNLKENIKPDFLYDIVK